MKNVKITVNGHEYQVEIGDLNTSPMEVAVNGKKYMVEVDASVVSEEPAMPPLVKNVQAPTTTPRYGQPAPSAGDAQGLRAPMPGLILDVCVKPGDKVTRGQHMMSLEAMKMKNSIRSPRDAVIASVAVVDDQKVAYNDLLVTFE
jgi:glutaconyl-CoA/methylmalonyl-CoA decarboxylase subunit gamma